MSIKNEAKIKNPLIVAIREQLEHRALWMYLLLSLIHISEPTRPY